MLRTAETVEGPWTVRGGGGGGSGGSGEVTIKTSKSSGATSITNPAVWFNGTAATLLYRQPGGVWPNSNNGSSSERLGIAVAGADACSTSNDSGSGAGGDDKNADPGHGGADGCTYIDMTPTAPIFDFALEDAFLWQDARQNWHALTHKKEPGYGPKGDAGHLFSMDGTND